jgi:hypothetical protein
MGLADGKEQANYPRNFGLICDIHSTTCYKNAIRDGSVYYFIYRARNFDFAL